MVTVTSVEVVGGRTVSLQFDDGSKRTRDLTPLLCGPMFDDIVGSDQKFAEVCVDHEAGTIVWPNGADLDPDVLHGDYEPAVPSSVER